MTSRERVIRALRFECPDRAPRELWALAGVTMLRRTEYDDLLHRYPSDFAQPDFRYGESKLARGSPGEIGTYIDEWGCGWSVAEVGVCGEVKHPPLAEWSTLATYRPPMELLESADLRRVDQICAESDAFVRTNTHVRPFERMQFLRGSENLLVDLAYQPAELFQLRDMIHEFNLREMKMWAKTDVDGVSFMDDWGAQHSLLISPYLWRTFFKPMYKEYCDILRKAGKYVFFHSDGHIFSIYPDLIELGVSAVNSQLFCMDIEEIGRRFKGCVCFWGEIDRQQVLPFGTVDEVRQAVRRVRLALDDGRGGVIAQCEWGNRDPQENIEAVFRTWTEPLDA